jgi:hypothetical protein
MEGTDRPSPHFTACTLLTSLILVLGLINDPFHPLMACCTDCHDLRRAHILDGIAHWVKFNLGSLSEPDLYPPWLKEMGPEAFAMALRLIWKWMVSRASRIARRLGTRTCRACAVA